MERLINYSKVVYDANIIIYYCFLYNNHRIVEYTNKARKLTQFLVENNVEIWIPEFIIHEINHKGFPRIVEEYINNKNSIVGVSANPSHGFVLRLVKKLQNNFRKLQQKDYFHVKSYSPNP